VPVAPGLRERDFEFAGVQREAQRAVAGRRRAPRRHRLIEQTIGRLPFQPDMGKDAPEHVDQDVGLAASTAAGECETEVEFWGGHDGRFYSERRPNSTRARPQSAAICDFSTSSDSNARSSRRRWTNATRTVMP
jgi:hypothetical protein